MTVLGFTRPAAKIEASVKEAESLGFEVMAAPSLEAEMAGPEEFRRLEDSLVPGAVAVFGSTTSVDMCQRFFGDRFSGLFEGHEVYAIGSRTADSLTGAGISVTEVPGEYSSYGLVELLKDRIDGLKVVMIRSDSGTHILSEGIEGSGADLADIAVYKLGDAGINAETVAMMDAIAEGRMDWMAFTSPKSAAVFFGHMEERFGKERGRSYMADNVKVAAIGRPTAESLDKIGRPADLIPEKSTFRDLLLAIRDRCRSE